jgi:hypothetical protein
MGTWRTGSEPSICPAKNQADAFNASPQDGDSLADSITFLVLLYYQSPASCGPLHANGAEPGIAGCIRHSIEKRSTPTLCLKIKVSRFAESHELS